MKNRAILALMSIALIPDKAVRDLKQREWDALFLPEGWKSQVPEILARVYPS